MSGKKYRLPVTPAQTHYLKELIEDDILDTELTPSERQQARSLLRKLNDLHTQQRFDAAFTERKTAG